MFYFALTFRALGTPNNEVWPEVESLQDYKNTFPKWKPGSLASHVKNLDENGLDLLSVRSTPYTPLALTGDSECVP